MQALNCTTAGGTTLCAVALVDGIASQPLIVLHGEGQASFMDVGTG